MSNNATSNVNPLSAIIAGVIRDEATALNRSAAMIEHMFANEITYSADAIIGTMRLEGAKRTEAIDKQLADISDEFKGAQKTLAAIKEMKSADRTEADVNAQTALTNQLRAARIMYTRALSAVFGLRSEHMIGSATVYGACEVKASKRKTGSLAIEYVKSQEGNKIKTLDKEQSCADLIRIGEKLITEKLGKAKKTETKVRNPMSPVAALSDSSKALAATLSGLVATKNQDRFDMLVNNKELDGNIKSIVKNVLDIECSDGKTIDYVAVSAFLSSIIGHDVTVRPVVAKTTKAA